MMFKQYAMLPFFAEPNEGSVAMDAVSSILATEQFGSGFGRALLEPTPIGDGCKVVVVPKVSVHHDQKLLTSDVAADLVHLMCKRSNVRDLVNIKQPGSSQGNEELGTSMGLTFQKKQGNERISSFSMSIKSQNKKRRVKNNDSGISCMEDNGIHRGELHSSLSVPAVRVGSCTPPPTEATTSSRNEETDDDTIDFSYFPLSLKNGCSNIVQTRRWYMRYRELLAFKAVTGHCCVPNVYPPNTALAQWVKRQRYQYKLKLNGHHSTLTEEREKALEAIDFVWTCHSAAWMERFAELATYRAKNGHCNVPSNHPHIRQLSVWVKCQRRQYRLYQLGNPRSNMTPERIAKMKSVDFSFNPRNL